MGNNSVTEIDLEALENHIATLERLKTEWTDKTYEMPAIGECGGSTIITLEAIWKLFQDMQDSFVTLLSNTVSYMTERKLSVEEKDQAGTEVIEETVVSSVKKPTPEVITGPQAMVK